MSLLITLGGGILLIILSADYFTNGIEWLGHRLGLSEGAVGSLLAAIGTALPETLVPIVAIFFGPSGSHESIGLGAILGAPFMLATLGFAVIGVGLERGQTKLVLTDGALIKDLGFFLLAFTAAILASLGPSWLHLPIALGLVAGYLVHAWNLIRLRGGETASSAPEQFLHLYHGPKPPFWVICVEVAMALSGLIVGARFFVLALGQLTGVVHLSGFLLSVIVTPVATELPEVLNSVIWLRKGRNTLAVGNVSGAMVFQASLVPALGIAITPWRLTPWELTTAVLAWAAALYLYLRARRGWFNRLELIGAGLFYLTFIGLVMISG